MRVSDYMTPNPVTIRPDENLRTAIDRMVTVGRRLPVVTEQGELVGIITDRDIRLAVNSPLVLRERWQDEMLLQQTEVAGIMSSDVITIEPEAGIAQAANLMLDNGISGLPVVDSHGKLIGIITITDMLRALIRREEDELLNQP